MQEIKPGYTVVTHETNSSPFSRKPILSTSKDSEASKVEHYEQCLRERFCQKYPGFWWNQGWLTYSDSVLVHTALSVLQFLAAKSMAVVPHPCYLPHFSLFLRMRT